MIMGETINDYFCETCQKKQDITKKLCLSVLPNVLIIHLQRIVFDMDTFENKKINSHNKRKLNHRFSKKKAAPAAPAADAPADTPAAVKNFTLDVDPFIYFFNMFTSNSDNTVINYGDIFRIKKYHKLFQSLDIQGGKVYIVYPEALTQ